MHAQIHVGDTGTGFQGVAKKGNGDIIDISDATLITMKITKPDDTELIVNANFGTDGTDGIFRYETEASDLDIPGHYKLQAFLQTPDGAWRSNIISFTVYPNI
jgi:hypothetical protein